MWTMSYIWVRVCYGTPSATPVAPHPHPHPRPSLLEHLLGHVPVCPPPPPAQAAAVGASTKLSLKFHLNLFLAFSVWRSETTQANPSRPCRQRYLCRHRGGSRSAAPSAPAAVQCRCRAVEPGCAGTALPPRLACLERHDTAPSLPRLTYAPDGVCLLSSAGEIIHPGFFCSSRQPRLSLQSHGLSLSRAARGPSRAPAHALGLRAPPPFGSANPFNQ